MIPFNQLSKEWFLAVSLCDAIDNESLRHATFLIYDKHANPNVIIPNLDITPLHLSAGHKNDAFGKKVTKLLLQNGGNPNIKGVDGVTPLHVAAAWNKATTARLLLSSGADPWIEDDSGKNAFHHAHNEEAWETIKVLENHKCSIFSKDSSSNNKYSPNDVKGKKQCKHCHSKSSKQSVATQTTLPLNKSSPKMDESEEFISAYNSPDDDKSFDWIGKMKDTVITDLCKQKIFHHRTKTETYEYSPRLTSSSESKDLSLNVTNENSCSSVPRYLKKKSCNTEVQSQRGFLDIEISYDESEGHGSVTKSPCPIAVESVTSPSSEELFSDDSLITEDRSYDLEFPKLIEFVELTQNIPYIDESVSECNSHYNASQKNESEKPKFESTDEVKENQLPFNVQIPTEIPKENTRHVSWSACLNTCVCIPKSKNDDSVSSFASQDFTKGENKTDPCISAASSVKKFEYSSKEASPEEENISIEFKYTDDEDPIEFIEAKMPLSKNHSNKPSTQLISDETELSDFSAYDTDYIRRELKKLGFVSGPIAGTPTKRLYLRKLKRIRQTVSSPVMNLIKQPNFSSELEQVLNSDDWLETLTKWSILERQLRDHFQDQSFSSSWRAGTAKTSFTYLLLDPRVTNNLPARCENMNLIDVWRTFVRSIFYVGKGTRARQYEHLNEAFQIWRETKALPRKHCNVKVSFILEIWKEGLGVVIVQVFRNLIPAEAFTREAAMIDALGLARLKNEKAGIYYGLPNSWNIKMRKRLGAFLLYRAMRMFIADNEVQLKPSDVH